MVVGTVEKKTIKKTSEKEFKTNSKEVALENIWPNERLGEGKNKKYCFMSKVPKYQKTKNHINQPLCREVQRKIWRGVDWKPERGCEKRTNEKSREDEGEASNGRAIHDESKKMRRRIIHALVVASNTPDSKNPKGGKRKILDEK